MVLHVLVVVLMLGLVMVVVLMVLHNSVLVSSRFLGIQFLGGRLIMVLDCFPFLVIVVVLIIRLMDSWLILMFVLFNLRLGRRRLINISLTIIVMLIVNAFQFILIVLV